MCAQRPFGQTKKGDLKMKRFRTIAIVLVLVTLLAACGGGGGSPVGVVKDFWKALTKFDIDKMKELTCSEYRSEMEEAFGFAEMGDLSELADLMEFDVSGLKYEVVSESGDNAVVRVYGELKVTFFGQSESEQMDEEIPVVKEGGQWKVCGGGGF
jgi:hypothetical protein